jgi:hypothetical protein
MIDRKTLPKRQMSDIVRRKRSDVIIELFNQKRLVVHSSLGGDGVKVNKETRR